MSATLAFALVTAAALDVHAPAGCLDAVELAAAIEEVGGIDVAESVAVTITPVMDSYALVVDIALIDAPSVHREVPLRPRECADVADLVAVLLQGQRRAALEARLRPPPAMTLPLPREALPADDPRRKPADFARNRDVTFPNPCEGPLPCGGFRGGVSFAGAVPLGARMAVDIGYDVSPEGTAIVVVDGYERSGSRRAAGSLGIAWRKKIGVLELSGRGLFGAGAGSAAEKSGAPSAVACVVDKESSAVRTVSEGHSAVFIQPTVAVRSRIGYVFAEAGASWAVGLDELPGAYLAIGVSLFGP